MPKKEAAGLTDEDRALIGDVPASDRKVTAKDNQPPAEEDDGSLRPKLTPRNAAGKRLRAFVERIESLEEEVKSLNDDKRDVYAEAKGDGFDTKVIRKIITRRKKDAAEIAEEEAILDIYLHALGMGPAPEDD